MTEVTGKNSEGWIAWGPEPTEEEVSGAAALFKRIMGLRWCKQQLCSVSGRSLREQLERKNAYMCRRAVAQKHEVFLAASAELAVFLANAKRGDDEAAGGGSKVAPDDYYNYRDEDGCRHNYAEEDYGAEDYAGGGTAGGGTAGGGTAGGGTAGEEA